MDLNPDPVKQLAAQRLTEELLNSGVPEIARSLGESLARLADPALEAGVLAALQAAAEDQVILDELWAAWEHIRRRDLGRLLQGQGRPAAQPLGLRILSLLELGQVEAAAAGGRETIQPLLQAAIDPDEEIADRAGLALRHLQASSAREELCHQVIERNPPAACQAALEAGYAPRDPQQRALFFLLTEQWERYEALDFDARLLSAVYATADPDLRSRIASLARHSGWAGFVEAVGGRASRRLEELNDQEWEVILAVLGRRQAWEEIWRLAQAAPPLWSARLLVELGEAGWQPPDSQERTGFTGLISAARACQAAGQPLPALVRPQATLPGHSRPVTCLAASPTGNLLASGGGDRLVRLWALPGGEARPPLEGHGGSILGLAFSPDASILASASADRTVRLWKLPDGQTAGVLGGHAGQASVVAFHPGGDLLASADEQGVHLWRLPEGQLLARLLSVDAPGQAEAGLTSLAFSIDGQLLIGGTEDNSLHLWQLPDSHQNSGMDLAGLSHRRLMERAASFSLSPDGKTLATAASYGRVRLWSLSTPVIELIRTLEGRSGGRLLSFSPDSRLLATADGNHLRLWHTGEPAPWLEFEAPTGTITSLVFSPDGRLLASGGDDRSLRLWGLRARRQLTAFDGLAGPVRHLAFDASGNHLASADEGRLRLWELHSLAPLLERAPTGLDEAQVAWPESLLHGSELAAPEKSWVGFSLSLVRWRRRYDIEVETAPETLTIGEFDIEIE